MNFPAPIEAAIAFLRAWFRERLRVGVFCMICGRHAQIRERSISAPQAKALLAVVTNYMQGQPWTRTRNLDPTAKGFSCPDFTGLKHWGLVEPMPGKCDPTKKTSGYWGPTALALNWVRGRVTVPRYVDVLDDAVTGTSEDNRITFQDALKVSFNYSEFAARITPREPQLPGDKADQ